MDTVSLILAFIVSGIKKQNAYKYGVFSLSHFAITDQGIFEN